MVALLKPTKKWRFSSLFGAGHSPHWAEFSPREGGRWIPRGLLRILGTHEGGSLKSHHTHIHFLILIQLMMFYSPMSSSSSHSAAQLGCYASSGGGIFPQAVAQTGYFGHNWVSAWHSLFPGICLENPLQGVLGGCWAASIPLAHQGLLFAGNHDPMESSEVRISDGGYRKTVGVAGTP